MKSLSPTWAHSVSPCSFSESFRAPPRWFITHHTRLRVHPSHSGQLSNGATGWFPANHVETTPSAALHEQESDITAPAHANLSSSNDPGTVSATHPTPPKLASALDMANIQQQAGKFGWKTHKVVSESVCVADVYMTPSVALKLYLMERVQRNGHRLSCRESGEEVVASDAIVQLRD